MISKDESNEKKSQPIGLLGFMLGCIFFLLSFNYMTAAIKFESIGSLAGTVFFDLLGTTAIISSVIVYVGLGDSVH